MAQTIKLKRSGTQGAAPSTSNLELGEVAINTYDGKMYIKKSVGGTESIVEVGGSSSSVSYLEAGMVEYEYTATSNQTTFSGSDSNSATLSYTANSIMVFLNGVLQDDGVDYTATNGTSVVFGSALTANDEVRIIAINTVASTSNLQNPTKLDAITTVNSQAAYSLTLNSSAYTPSSEAALIVSLNGITQEPGDSFTVSGSTITFSPALVTGDVVDYIVDMGRAAIIGQYDSDLVVTGDITPGTDSTYDLGASGTEWANVYADTVTAGNIVTTGYLRGPSTFTIDPATHGDNTGTLVVAGNLQVDGTTTTVNSTTMTVDDLNITLASGAANATAANGAGITVDGASASLTYDATNDEWDFNKSLNISGNLTSTGIDDNATGKILTLSGSSTTNNSLVTELGSNLTSGYYLKSTSYGLEAYTAVNATSTEIRLKGGGDTILKYNDTADAIYLRTNDTDRLSVSSVGNVGIGIAVASSLLHVYNDVDAQEQIIIAETFGDTGQGRGTGISFRLDGTEMGRVNAHETRGMTFYATPGSEAAAVERMRIDTDGNLGIGTDSPAQLLDVGDHDTTGNRSIRISQRTGTNTTTYGGLEFFYNNTAGTTGVNAAIYYAAGSQRNYGELAFHTGNAGTLTERVRIERSGNVGIGTSTPESLLHLVGGSGTKILIEDSANLRGNYIGIEGSDNLIIAADEDQAGADSSIRFRIDADEKMRITSNGDVGIGRTAPNHNLHIHQVDSGGTWIQFTNSTTGTSTADGAIVGLDSAEEFNIRVYENKPIDFWTNNTHQIRITDSGELHLYKGILDLTDLEDPALPVSIESTGTLGNGGSYDSSLKDDGQLQYNAASHLFADTSSVINGYPSAWYEIDGGFRWGLSSTEVLTVNSSGNVQVDISGARSGLSSLSITDNPFTIGSLTDFNVAFDTNEIQARNNGAANNLILNKNGGTVGIGTTNNTYVLEIEAAGDNGIRMASTSSHASLFLDSASGSGTYLRFTENGTNNWWINATTASSGYLWFRPQASATSILQLGHDYKIVATGSDTVGDASYYHVTINNNQTGSGTLTNDRTHATLYVNTDNSQSGGDTVDEIRSYGVYADTRITADADLCVGVFGYARTDKSSGTTTNIRGGQFQALGHDSAGGVVSNIQGVYASAGQYQVETTSVMTAGSFLSQATATGNGDITNFEAVRGETQVDSGYTGTIATGFTFRAMHDNNNSTTHTHNTHYLYYGDYTGTLPTTARGLWINDDVPSRFSGDLHVNGTLTKTSGSFQISHPLPSMANTHDLVHSFVESPQPDNIYSGMVALVDGSATINIDTAAGMTEGTFVLLNKNIRRTVTNEEGFTAVKSSLSGNILTITAQDNTCTDEVFWMVIGQRNDAEIKALHTTDSEGNLIVEPEKGPEWVRPDRSEETTTTYDPENPFPDQE